MASAVTAKLDFGPDIAALLPRFALGEAVALRATFTDTMTLAPVEVSDLTVIVTLPGGYVMQPAPVPVRTGVGVWQIAVPAGVPDRWRVEVRCDHPDVAVAWAEFVVAAPRATVPQAAPPPQGAVTTVNGEAGPNVTVTARKLGAVQRVNGLAPDENGAIVLSPLDVDVGIGRQIQLTQPASLTLGDHHNATLILTEAAHQISVAWADTGASFSCVLVNATTYDVTPLLIGFTEAVPRNASGRISIPPGGTAALFCQAIGGERVAYLVGEVA